MTKAERELIEAARLWRRVYHAHWSVGMIARSALLQVEKRLRDAVDAVEAERAKAKP